MSRSRRRRPIGERIAELRHTAQLTQAQLAAAIGISQAHLCRLELGRSRLQIDVLILIARQLRLPLSEIVEGM